jgi:predicted metalloendopeptidase
VKSRASLIALLAKLQGRGEGYPYQVFGYADLKNSGWVIGNVYQGGLGMPDRDYYTRTDSASVVLQKHYRQHISRMLQLLGGNKAQSNQDAAAIYAMEDRLARASLTSVELRDTEKQYHKMTLRELQTLAPELQWVPYMKSAGFTALASADSAVNVWQPEFVKVATQEIASAPIGTWKPYLRYHVVHEMANWLGKKFFDEAFTYQKEFSGAKQPLPRWKRAAEAVDASMGEALGKAYVAKYFGPEAKARMMTMLDNLKAAYAERIQAASWMSDSTKKQALYKLDAITRKIGYPDKWRDYTALEIDGAASGAENLIRAQLFEQKRQMAKIGKPVDRTEWDMTPPTVNAYYNPTNNEIVFPAGILQPPMFDPNVDDAYNYGATGMVIGHEMTHGFDDEGRKFDASGNLAEWWTKEDAQRFEQRAKSVSDQFDGYVAVDTLHVKGALTLGENIADLGGITIAYYAYQKQAAGKPREIIDGFTPEQRFFLGFAQSWRNKMRPERKRMLTNVDPHSPAEWRVRGPLSNMSEFARAFGCKPGDPMVRSPDKRAQIW